MNFKLLTKPNWRSSGNFTLKIALFLLLFTTKSFAQTKDATIGMTNNTGFNTDPAFVQRTINYDKELGIYKVRMGMDGVGGYNENDSFNWTARDATVDKYIAEGFSMHCVIAARAHTNRYTTWEQWKKNYEYFCRNVMTHYQGKITYYIVDNEPDLGYGAPIGDAITPAQSVEFTKIAFTVAQSIDPNLRIESPPTMSPETGYLREMVSLGVTQYCHYLGFHAYGSQLDDGRLSKPWEYMSQFYNFPQRPIALSETGTNPNWKPAGMDGLEWQARWFDQLNVAAKRYGIDNVLLYRLDESAAEWDILNKPAYNAIKNAYQNKNLTNGGFETSTTLVNPNEWMKYFSADVATPPANINVITADKKSGVNALKIDGSGSLRQIIGLVTPGTQVTVSAWVKATNGGTAKLTLQGYNKTAGDAEVEVSSAASVWTLITASVTPTNSYLVVELESTGGNCFFDDVSVSAPSQDQVYISSPANNTLFQWSPTGQIKIDAGVLDSDNSITKVEFFSNAVKIGESSVKPFSYTWIGTPEGDYTLTAKAYNSTGTLISTSAGVLIYVKDPAVLKVPDLIVRNVTWSPANVTSGTTVTFKARVKNIGTGPTKAGTILGGVWSVNGSVVNWSDTYTTSLAVGDSVELTATGGPSGTNTWTAVSGFYTVDFRVDDINRIDEKDEGNNTYGTTICVNSSNGVPYVKINSPANASVIPLGQITRIDVTAADCDGSISKVEYFADGIKIGEVTSSPYALNWSTVKIGATLLKVIATDNTGKISESTVTVTGELRATYEAEDAQLYRALVKGRYGASQQKSVGSIDFDDSSVEYNVYVTKAGNYKVKLGYSNGMGAPSTQKLFVNQATTPITLNYAPTSNWDTFSALIIYTQLVEGKNKLTIKKGDLFGEVDYVNLTFADPNLINFEAEDAVITNASIGNKSGASGGKYVGSIGDNSLIEFNIQSLKKGPSVFSAQIGYANGMGSPSTFLIKVNGGVEYAVTVPATANWDVFSSVMDTVLLEEGANKITVRKGSQYADLDYINMKFVRPANTRDGMGKITYQRWDGIAGTSAALLTGNANYPNSPSFTAELTSMEAASSVGDNYGARITGYIVAPATGAYTFWIAGDDNSELWLSTNGSPSNKVKIASHTDWTNSREWNKFSTQKSVSINLTAGTTYYVEALMKEGSGGDNLAVGWLKPGQTGTIPSEVVPGSVLSKYPPKTNGGRITYQRYDGIGGTDLALLTGNANYPNNPSSTTELTSMEAATNVADNYGARMVGYITAPSTGPYTFWIAGDDQCELWLGTNESAGSRVKIASHYGWTNSKEWNKYSSQKSVSINLTAGTRYYVEALMKEGAGGDNLAVGWLKPGQTGTVPSEVIPGSVLSPYLTSGRSRTGNDEVVALNENSEDGIQIYPNPANDKVTVSYNAEQEGATDIVFFDLLAKPLITKQHQSKKGFNKVEFDTSSLQSGIHVLHIRLGGRRIIRKILINKN